MSCWRCRWLQHRAPARSRSSNSRSPSTARRSRWTRCTSIMVGGCTSSRAGRDNSPSTTTPSCSAVAADQPPTLAERLFAVRPSRYCPSDLLEAFAEAELNMPDDLADRGRMIGDWVSGHCVTSSAAAGRSTPPSTRCSPVAGVPDFAHLTVALCRTVGVPARLAWCTHRSVPDGLGRLLKSPHLTGGRLSMQRRTGPATVARAHRHRPRRRRHGVLDDTRWGGRFDQPASPRSSTAICRSTTSRRQSRSRSLSW